MQGLGSRVYGLEWSVLGLGQTSRGAVEMRVSVFDPRAEIDDPSRGHRTKPLDIIPAMSPFNTGKKTCIKLPFSTRGKVHYTAI